MDKAEMLDRLDDAGSQILQVAAAIEQWQPPPPAIDFPVFGQQWQPWCNDRLGFGSYTIGGYGCVICSMAMIVSHANGDNIEPDIVNVELQAVNGFVPNSSLVYWAKLQDAFDWCIKYDGTVGCIDVPAPVARVDEWLAGGGYVIVRVDFEPRKAGVTSHYLPLFAGSSGSFYYGIDPWIGSPVRLPPAYSERAGWDAARAIYRVVYYSKR